MRRDARTENGDWCDDEQSREKERPTTGERSATDEPEGKSTLSAVKHSSGARPRPTATHSRCGGQTAADQSETHHAALRQRPTTPCPTDRTQRSYPRGQETNYCPLRETGERHRKRIAAGRRPRGSDRNASPSGRLVANAAVFRASIVYLNKANLPVIRAESHQPNPRANLATDEAGRFLYEKGLRIGVGWTPTLQSGQRLSTALDHDAYE